MTDPVPSKELLYGATTKVEEIKATLLDMRAFGLRGDLPSDEALYLIGEIESARRTAEHWKAEHLAGNAEIERLQRQQTNLIAALGEAQAKIDELAIHAEKWVKRATTPAHEREMPHCSTCACPPYDAKALDEARRFKVGDEVPIAHWGATSKIVSIHCTLANGETIAVDCIAPEPSAEQVLERGRQVEEQGLRLRHRVSEHPVPRTGYVLVWHEQKGELFPTAWHAQCYHHPELGANLYPPAAYWEIISPPDSTQPPGDGQ